MGHCVEVAPRVESGSGGLALLVGCARRLVTDEPIPGPVLSTTGQVYVTLAAARSYARDARRAYAEGVEIADIGEARRELAELLGQARRVRGDTSTPELWRYRRRSTGVDITARVVREGVRAVVVAVSARAYRKTGRDR